MTSAATRSYVRRSGDVPSETIARREAAKADRREALEARIAAADPAIVAAAKAAVNRSRRKF